MIVNDRKKEINDYLEKCCKTTEVNNISLPSTSPKENSVPEKNQEALSIPCTFCSKKVLKKDELTECTVCKSAGNLLSYILLSLS